MQIWDPQRMKKLLVYDNKLYTSRDTSRDTKSLNMALLVALMQH